MNINTLMTNLETALKNNVALLAWYQTNFSKDPEIRRGTDPKSPPNADNYPIIHIFPMTKTEGYDLTRRDHLIGCNFGIINGAVVTSGLVTTYTGVVQIEENRMLIMDAIKGTTASGGANEVLTIGIANTEFELIDYFPKILGAMDLLFTYNYAQGDVVFDVS